MSWAALVLATPSAFATKITFPAACWKVVDQNHYLIRGDRTSDVAGARLWNLDKLTQDWSLGRGDTDCTQAIYRQAVADGDEYWTRIGKNYHCNDPAVEPKPDVCTREKGYSDNHNYLSVVKAVMELPQGNGCLGERRGKVAQAHEEAPDKLVKGVVPALQKSLNAQTANPKEKVEAPAAEATASTCNVNDAKRSTEEALAIFGVGCGAGVFKQFVQEVWDLASGVGHAVIHPIDTVSSLAEFISEVSRNPEVVARQIAESYFDMWPKDKCLSSYEKSQAICKVATKVFFDIGLTIAGGTTIKWTTNIVKWFAKKAAKGAGKTLAVTGKIAGKVTPKLIKNPVKKAATAVADAATDKARIASLWTEYNIARAKMYITATKTGQTILKVKDKVVLIAESRAGKLVVKPTIYFAKMPLFYNAGNQQKIDQWTQGGGFKKTEAKIEDDKMREANKKFIEELPAKFEGATNCAQVKKAYEGLATEFKITKDDPKAAPLNQFYAMAASQIPNGCK